MCLTSLWLLIVTVSSDVSLTSGVSGIDNIYTISTHYLHTIYTLSTHYLYIIYTLSMFAVTWVWPAECRAGRGGPACPGPGIIYIQILSTHYLHTIYTLSTHYLHTIYTLQLPAVGRPEVRGWLHHPVHLQRRVRLQRGTFTTIQHCSERIWYGDLKNFCSCPLQVTLL